LKKCFGSKNIFAIRRTNWHLLELKKTLNRQIIRLEIIWEKSSIKTYKKCENLIDEFDFYELKLFI
jgi:hypothetical protein